MESSLPSSHKKSQPSKLKNCRVMLKKLMIPLKLKIGQWLISIGVFALNATAQNTITVLLLAPRFCNIFPENFHVNGDLNFALNLLIGFFHIF